MTPIGYASLVISIVSIGLSLWSLHNSRRIRRANERLSRIDPHIRSRQ